MAQETRVIETDTVKQCYFEINHIINQAISKLEYISNRARENKVLNNEGLVVILQHNRELIAELKSKILI
jgi:hypothetical protein